MSWFSSKKQPSDNDAVIVDQPSADHITSFRSMDEIEQQRTGFDHMSAPSGEALPSPAAPAPAPAAPAPVAQTPLATPLNQVQSAESSVPPSFPPSFSEDPDTSLNKPPPNRTCSAACGACCIANLTSPIFWAIFVTLGVTVGAGYLLTTSGTGYYRDYSVAFIGNYYLAVNDLPRMMEQLSKGTWSQNSCLHTRGSLATILETGNGMYNKWNGKYNAYDDVTNVYDYGTCTIDQLLTGNDEQISYQDENAAYYDDGRNPCFYDDDYYAYVYATGASLGKINGTEWDFVVFADQPKRMAIESSRNASISALEFSYSAYVEELEAIPIIISPHAFDSENTNMTGLGNIPQFSSLIHAGAEEYAAALGAKLPWRLQPRVAPIALAFLAVYEEDLDLWSLLTDADDIHASVFGSYLAGCVLFATVNNKMPPKEFSETKELFQNARSLSGRSWGYPTTEQATYLWEVAQRVVFRGYKPATLTES